MDEDRKLSFKISSTNIDSVKSKAKDFSIVIRKENRESCLSTKRFCTKPSKDGPENNPQNLPYTIANIQEVAKEFQKRSKSSQEQLKYLRTAFSYASDFIDAFMNVSNALHALIGYLTGKDSSLQLEAAWCITNISANDHTYMLTISKAVGAYLVTYLQSGSKLLQDQSALALGNMASDSHEVRMILEKQGILKPLINIIKQNEVELIQSALFALCNMARSRELTLPLLKENDLPMYIVELLSNYTTEINVVGELAWLLTYMTCEEENIEIFLQLNTVTYLTHWINKVRPHQKEYFFAVTPLLRCLGNIFGSSHNNNINMDDILTHDSGGLLLTLNNFLHSNKRYLIKECLWVVANIFTFQKFEMKTHLNDVLLLLPNISRHLNSAYEIKKEAVICLYNLAAYKELESYLYSEEILNSIINILKLHDVELTYLALQYIELLLSQFGTEAKELFLTLDGTSYLEALAYNDNKDVRTKALYLLEKYYENDNDPVE